MYILCFAQFDYNEEDWPQYKIFEPGEEIYWKPDTEHAGGQEPAFIVKSFASRSEAEEWLAKWIE